MDDPMVTRANGQTTRQRPNTPKKADDGLWTVDVLERRNFWDRNRLEVLASGTCPELRLQCRVFTAKRFNAIGPSVSCPPTRLPAPPSCSKRTQIYTNTRLPLKSDLLRLKITKFAFQKVLQCSYLLLVRGWHSLLSV